MNATKDLVIVLSILSLMIGSTAAWYIGSLQTKENYPYVINFVDTGFIVTQSDWVYQGNAKVHLTLSMVNNSTQVISADLELAPIDAEGNVIQDQGTDMTQYDTTGNIAPDGTFTEVYTFSKSGIRSELNVFQILITGEDSLITGDKLSTYNIEQEVVTSGGGTTLPVKSMIGYTSSTVNKLKYPKYRYYDTSWSDEIQIVSPAPSNLREIRMEFCPLPSRNDEAILVGLTFDGYLEAWVYNGFSWSNPTEIARVWSGWSSIRARPFDIAYESVSGNAIILYDNSLNNNGQKELAYRVWNGASWSQEHYLDDPKDNWPAGIDYRWVKLASDPNSDQIGFIGLDSGWWEYSLAVWDGDDWVDWKRVSNGPSAIEYESIDIAWEYTSGDCLAVMSDEMKIKYFIWDGGWSSASSFTMNGNWWNWNWLSLKPQYLNGTDRMMLVGLDTSTAVTAVEWTGSGWNGNGEVLDYSMETSDTRCIDGDWESTGTRFFVAGGDKNKNYLSYKTWTPSGGWSRGTNSWETYSGSNGNDQRWMQVKANPSGDDPLVTVAWIDDRNDLVVAEWNGVSIVSDVEFTPKSNDSFEGYEVAYSFR